MENPIQMDDLGVPLFSETPILTYIDCLGSYLGSLLPHRQWNDRDGMGSCGFLKFFCTSWISWAAEAARISLCPAVKASCGPSFPLMALVVFLQRRGRWFQLPCRDRPSCTCVSLAFSSLSGGATTQQILLMHDNQKTSKVIPRSLKTVIVGDCSDTKGVTESLMLGIRWSPGDAWWVMPYQPHPNGPLKRHHHSVAAKRNDQGTPGISQFFHEKKCRLWFFVDIS